MAAAILSQAIFMLAATLAIIALSSYQEVAAFSPQKSVKTRRIRGHNIIEYRRSSRVLSLSDKDDDDDNWGVGNDSNASYNDPRVDAMRSILESSWDGDAMGVVPSGPEKASEAAGN